ncbi:hypothetical protein [Streptomyces sp. NPDC088350]|uniref:hypothetical protein n=1 Tax=Streptomyces sp. NPDC088350 TaxID=3365854 RepID=UPI00382BC241
MKRRTTTSRTGKRSVHSWAASAGALTTAAAAALIAASPVDVTVAIGSAPHTVVVGQADIPNPVCPIRPR